jgi:hypothetical protein
MKGHTPELDVSQNVEAVGGEAARGRLGTEAEYVGASTATVLFAVLM